jgi:dUTP pyrophosphatase
VLRVKLLQEGARLPFVAHPGEDLGYDVFAIETTHLAPRQTARLRTGIAVEALDPRTGVPLGLIVRDRSSMAAKGLVCTGGVIDAGYRGELFIIMTNLGDSAIELILGERIAQIIPTHVLTGAVELVDNLGESKRATKGFGSSGL